MDTKKLKKCCNICQNSEKPKKPNLKDRIERTTDCQLVTEGGSSLKIRELDEEAIWQKRLCQCNAPDFGPKNTKNKKLQKMKNGNEEVDCEAVRMEFKPKWFHQFTENQQLLLDQLVWEIIDDRDEGTFHRVRRSLHLLGLDLPPIFKNLHSVMYYSTNPVIFLNNLIDIFIKLDNGKYCYNQRVLMSGIAYLEMPYLLQTLLSRLPKNTQTRIPPPEKKSVIKKAKNPNPYAQSIWPKTLANWQDERKKALARNQEIAKNRLKIKPPEFSTKNIQFMTHISPLTDPEIGMIPELEISKTHVLEYDECIVEKMLRELERKSPNNPPVSRSSHAINQHIQKICQGTEQLNIEKQSQQKILDKDFDTILNVTLKELADRGMISASYQQIKHHPLLIHLDKFIKEEPITRSLKLSLVDKTTIVKRCLKEWYQKSRHEDSKKRYPDKTWDFVKYLRTMGERKREKVLHHLWQQRVECGQNFWCTLSPEYPQVRSFLPVFSAYATSYKTGTNLWTIVPRET